MNEGPYTTTGFRSDPDELANLRHDIEKHLKICSEQAAEIDRLRAEVAQSRKALDLLQRMNKAIDGLELSDLTDDDGIWRYFTSDGPGFLDALQAEYAALSKGE